MSEHEVDTLEEIDTIEIGYGSAVTVFVGDWQWGLKIGVNGETAGESETSIAVPYKLNPDALLKLRAALDQVAAKFDAHTDHTQGGSDA